MSKVYLPTSEQMDITLKNLSRIAGALGVKADASSWGGIQQIVKAGNAPKMFPIGTQFTINHSIYGDMVFDVVAHDYFKSATDENAHTMTLMSKNSIASVQFDASEAFYYADKELIAGTYNFTLESEYSSWAAGTYQFTLTKNLPKGGQLCISGYANEALTARQVRAYASQTNTTIYDNAVITVGNGGTSLGALGKELNHAHRVSYGSNNYKESAIRQFLNSSANPGSVWTPQTKFDRPPSWQTTLAGFASGVEVDFLATVGKVVVPCAANNTYESADSTIVKNTKYSVVDKFYLASQRELFGEGTETGADDTLLFPYYEGATNIDRMKVTNGVVTAWWTRSSYAPSSINVQTINADGSSNRNIAVDNIGCVPVCTIV